MRGRRPKPTRMKVLLGNPGKRRLNEDEPRPEPAVPECPVELGAVARTEWDRLVAELAPLRILTHLDRAALAAYCGAYSLWAESTSAIQQYGAMVKSPTGYPSRLPAEAEFLPPQIVSRRSLTNRKAIVDGIGGGN
jgi:phage terminase small subunit